MLKANLNLTAPSFADFAGLRRTCVKFGKAKGGVYRCKKFASASKAGKHPKSCPPGLTSRSPGLIRLSKCVAGRKAKKSRRSRRR